MKVFAKYKTIATFLAIEAITIYATYFAPATVTTIWYLIMLLLYWRSKNEAFWFVVFFTTVDGFLGFFGLYIAVLKAIPGLPGIEVAQLYILLSIVKVLYKRKKANPFYGKWMGYLTGFLAFLVIYGFTHGISGEVNVYLRILKLLIPLATFYTLPRLINTQEQFDSLFRLLFLVTVLAFAAQLVTLFTGFSPNLVYRPVEEETEIEVGRNFRVLYNTGILIISTFGALYYLAYKGRKPFNNISLYVIVGIGLVMSFLSATRGWIISMGITVSLYFLLVQKLNVRQMAVFATLILAFAVLGIVNDTVSRQIQFSFERLLTLESLASGDVSAGGTLIRLDERGPLVMDAWANSPILGYGFSDIFFETADSHVGNQNILLHSGIVGFSLMFMFFRYLILKIYYRQKVLTKENPFRLSLMVFLTFLPGWIFLHSTSGQQFAYYGLPNDIFPQAVFLCVAAFAFNAAKRTVLLPKEDDSTDEESMNEKTKKPKAALGN